jgi:hypothetical protein
MTEGQRELLRRIAAGERAYGRENVGDPEDARRFDELVQELQELQSRGWIELHLNPNFMSSKGRWYAAAAIITRAGRDALGPESVG